MTASPALLAAIAEVCAWHDRVTMLQPLRTLPSGRREPILPPEVPDAIRRGEIAVPDFVIKNFYDLLDNEPTWEPEP